MNVLNQERLNSIYLVQDFIFYRKLLNNHLLIMSKSGKDFAIGLLTGAVLGSVAALLYAPDSGSNTRGRLSYQLSKYVDEINSMIKKLQDEKEKYSSDAKQKGDDVVTDAKKRADDLIKEAETLLENIEKSKRN
jgi:gas vesicle protein